MFSGKKSGLLVFTICKCLNRECAYVEEEVSVDEALVTHLGEVLSQLCVIENLCL